MAEEEKSPAERLKEMGIDHPTIVVTQETVDVKVGAEAVELAERAKALLAKAEDPDVDPKELKKEAESVCRSFISMSDALLRSSGNLRKAFEGVGDEE